MHHIFYYISKQIWIGKELHHLHQQTNSGWLICELTMNSLSLLFLTGIQALCRYSQQPWYWYCELLHGLLWHGFNQMSDVIMMYVRRKVNLISHNTHHSLQFCQWNVALFPGLINFCSTLQEEECCCDYRSGALVAWMKSWNAGDALKEFLVFPRALYRD